MFKLRDVVKVFTFCRLDVIQIPVLPTNIADYAMFINEVRIKVIPLYG
jgi:hypothetical protein